MRKEAVPATDCFSVERKFTEVCVFARPLAEPVAPPTIRHHAEPSSTMITDLSWSHDFRLRHGRCGVASDGEGELRDPDHTIKFLKECSLQRVGMKQGAEVTPLRVSRQASMGISLLTSPDLPQFRIGLTRL